MEQMNLISPEIMAEISNGNSTKLPDNTRKMLQIMASLNTPKELLASLLEIAEFSLHHVRYLAGPLVIHRSPWSDTIPQWLKFACIQERLELIFTEYEQNQVGVSSTATEVLTYMMPATYEAPLHRDYADLYLWVGNEVLTKYDKLPKGCKNFYEFLGDGDTSNASNNRIIHFNQLTLPEFLIRGFLLQRDSNEFTLSKHLDRLPNGCKSSFKNYLCGCYIPICGIATI